MNQAFPHKRVDKACWLSEYLDKQFNIYSEQNDTFINAWNKFNRWLQTQHKLRNLVGLSHDTVFTSISVKLIYQYQKKYSAEKIKAHSLLKITQLTWLSNQLVINNASFYPPPLGEGGF